MVQVLTMSAESPALYPPRPSFFPSHRVPWAWNERTVETFEETKQISSPVPINYVGDHRKTDLSSVPHHNED